MQQSIQRFRCDWPVLGLLQRLYTHADRSPCTCSTPQATRMSAAYVRAARKADVPPQAKRVLLALCAACNDAGECDLTQSALGRACSIYEGTVSRSLAALEIRGYLRIKPHPYRRGYLYQITDLKDWGSDAALSSSLFRAFPTCSLLKPHADSIDERA